MCKNNDLEDANLHNKIKLSEDFFFKLIQIIIYKIIPRRPVSMKQVKFVQMKDGDKEDYEFLIKHEVEHTKGTADRLIKALLLRELHRLQADPSRLPLILLNREEVLCSHWDWRLVDLRGT